MKASQVFAVSAFAAGALADACSPLQLVYARATTEPPQNITIQTTAAQFEIAADKVWSKGYGAAGYSLFQNLTALMPTATGYAVHYPANWQMNISAPTGVKDMLAHLEQQSKACPNQKFALGGHSQGSGVTVRAIPSIPANILAKVVAVTMFGGQACPSQVAGRCKSFCNAGDACMGGSAKGVPKAVVPPAVPPKASPVAAAKGTWINLAAPNCTADVEEKGHQPITVKGESAHTVYNKDGYYVKAAACYIVSQYKKLGGT
jgi:hypothetical protein